MRLGMGLRMSDLLKHGAGGYTGTLLDGLVSYWPLDEESGTRYDAVGDNDLTDNNTVGFAEGKHNNAASFVGANGEFLSVADGAGTVWGEDGNGVTVAMWVKPNGNPVGYALLFGRNSLASDAERNFNIFTESGSLTDIYIEFNAGARIQTVGSSLTDGVWQLLICWFDPTDKKQRLSINDETVLTSLAGATTVLSSPTSDVAIGGWSAFAAYFNGGIDEPAIWSRALTADERSELYNAGAGFFYPFT